MRKLLGGALALSLTATSAFAGGVSGGNANSNWTIYGWQNYSYELVDDEGADREYDRIQANAANIGFAASIDTGLTFGGQAIKANFQCEQFTYHNRGTSTGLCNRNSKTSLSGAFGELMVGQWLLPHNEMVAQWVDPFYDAGDDSHTSIMGSIGYGTIFYNGGNFEASSSTSGADFDYSAPGATNQGFNRRQEEIIQYFSPNMNGLNFRIATTSMANSDTDVTNGSGNTQTLDPRIWSMGVAYETTLSNNDSVWFAVTYERHDEWAALDYACDDSEDDSYRIAGRYVHDYGNGMSTKIAGMWETLEYDWDDCGAKGGVLYGGGKDLDLERDAWMVSGVHNFGNGLDIRASYMDADEFECGSNTCTEDKTDAKAYNLGVYYTMPAGTELRLTYSKVDNDDNANYGFGINGTGMFDGQGGTDVDMWAVGLVQWF